MDHHIAQEKPNQIDRLPALRFNEVAEVLDKLAGEFADVTKSFEQIIKDAGAISASPNIPENGIKFDKYAAAAIISKNWMELLAGPDVDADAISRKINVAVQLGKIGDKRKIALPGGII
ncbi:MAG TPA: hypothetical protein PKD37_06445 [Oligoflexia bacterium]|nr:hypothetical protein [Oligoflexia bacterium]HMP27600.1 hypothetical protein [Oligoflexia bacterium]